MNEIAIASPSGRAADHSPFRHPKVTARHQQLTAALYVRQSTTAQLREHQESTARQYAMKDRVVALGWSPDDVMVIDDDLGLSGSGSANGQGFRRLLKLVTDQKVGLVAGLEMSRLARNSKDWSDLFEVCAIFDTLIADEDGIFDPHDPNDRLVLGLKGIISELELHTMKVRLERGRLSKARRGELFHDVPVGYIPPEQWKVLLHDRHPAYITWQQYCDNQAKLRDNDSRPDRSGAPRNGTALMGGIVRCGNCGRRLAISYPKRSYPMYYCSRHSTVAFASPCHSSIRCEILDPLVTAKLLEALSPAGVELSLRVIQDEQARRQQMEQLHVDRVQQACYAVEIAERGYRHVDPANRLVAARLEQGWEQALKVSEEAKMQLNELRDRASIRLEQSERDAIGDCARDVSALWDKHMSLVNRKEIVRLLLKQVTVTVQNNSQRVDIRLHWQGGYESVYETIRTVTLYPQMDNYRELMNRMLQLVMQGNRSPAVAAMLEQEGYQSPRHNKPISATMIGKLLRDDPASHRQLTDPHLSEHQWLISDLARAVGVTQKKLKDWVRNGWALANQRPFGRVWLFWADASELERLRQLSRSQSRKGCRGPSELLRTPTRKDRKTT